jgi:hypothetical protein
MRKAVVVFIAAVMVLALAGCGGSKPATTTSTTAAPAAPAAAPEQPAVPGQVAKIVDKSENETTTFEPFPTGPALPADVKQRLDAKKAMLIYFYDPGQQTSTEVRSIIDDVRSTYRGTVDLLAYDIGKYVSTSETASISVDPSFSSDQAAVQAVELARALDVAFTPFIVLVDDQGYVIYRHRGLVDQEFLEREVQRAAQ